MQKFGVKRGRDFHGSTVCSGKVLVGGSEMKYGNGREALLAAVVKVVGESGLVGLTNRKVGSAAGVDNSLITYYFGSRDGLLEAATEWATDRSLEQLSVLAEARLGTSFAEAIVDLVRADPNLQLFQFEMIWQLGVLGTPGPVIRYRGSGDPVPARG